MSLILKVTIKDVFRKTPKLTPPCTAQQTKWNTGKYWSVSSFQWNSSLARKTYIEGKSQMFLLVL